MIKVTVGAKVIWMVTVMAIAKVVAVFGKDRTVFVRYENSFEKNLKW